jgi:transposase
MDLNTISGDTPILYVGIDAANNKHDVTALNVQGKTVLKHLTFSNTRAGFELLDQSLRQLNQDCLLLPVRLDCFSRKNGQTGAPHLRWAPR